MQNYMSMGGMRIPIDSHPGMTPAAFYGGNYGSGNAQGYVQSSETDRTMRRRMQEEEERRQQDELARLAAAMFGEPSQSAQDGNQNGYMIDPSNARGMSELNNTFGGSSPRDNQWTVYNRGVIPTLGIRPGFGGVAEVYENRQATSIPRFYEYTGAGPDPGRMMRYPGSPEMWDETGGVNIGSTAGFGAARAAKERINSMEDRINRFSSRRSRRRR